MTGVAQTGNGASPPAVVNAMSIDVEDYFQVSAFEGVIPRASWDAMPCRVERNTERILALLDEAGAHATFFILGWMCERYPGLVRRIAHMGHEVASHGYDHTRIIHQTPGELRQDVLRTKGLLEDAAGQVVRGFRAASFSITPDTLWAHDVLEETGHAYSSSVYPVRHDLYGIPDAPRRPYEVRPGGIVEIPVSTVRILGRNFPCGGGGFFRLLPYAYFRAAIRHLNGRERVPSIFYLHPWEVDPGQPRQSGISLKTRVRHYTNLAGTHDRLRRLLGEFAWGRVDEVFESALTHAPVAGAGMPELQT